MNDTKKAAKRTAAHDTAAKLWTDRGAAAMKEHAKERRPARAAERTRPTGKRDVLAKIADMPESDRVMAERIHAVVKASAPVLSPKTWYGMPAYARDGKVVCFFTGRGQVQVALRDVRLQR